MLTHRATLIDRERHLAGEQFFGEAGVAGWRGRNFEQPLAAHRFKRHAMRQKCVPCPEDVVAGGRGVAVESCGRTIFKNRMELITQARRREVGLLTRPT